MIECRSCGGPCDADLDRIRDLPWPAAVCSDLCSIRYAHQNPPLTPWPWSIPGR